ncbi:phosphatidate cytidylyltransferase [Sulfolobales archaeon HS-7]|nr:phosphatidate cytidylyltransferase [Sulfolobales archaeon HS-7]
MIFGNIVWGIILTVWVTVVTLFISRIVEKRTNKYVSRKIIHMLGGGVVATLAPFVFSTPLIIIIMSYLLTIVLLVSRLGRKGFYWFQEKGNYGEIFFTLSFGTLPLVLWIQNHQYWNMRPEIWVAIVPLMYMSFGDGVTGILRNYIYKKRVKGLWGTVGMLIVSSVIGYIYLGLLGILSAIIATFAEILPKIDDNITIPLFSALVLWLFLH